METVFMMLVASCSWRIPPTLNQAVIQEWFEEHNNELGLLTYCQIPPIQI